MKKIVFDGDKKNVISRTLRLKRIERSLDQTTLAAKMQAKGVNIDQQMISRIEHNRRIVTDYELACFCSVLDVSIEEMLKDFYKEYKDIL